MKIPLPPERATAFEMAGKQAVLVRRQSYCETVRPLKIEMGGKAILELSRLDNPSAKAGEAVSGGAVSAVHLDR